MLARRSAEQPEELAYYLSNAAPETPLLTLAQVAGARWRIEQALEEAKGEAGLDEYEVRYWPSWHRHITFSLMAPTWLTSIRRQERQRERGKKGRPVLECGATSNAERTGRVNGGGSPAPISDRVAVAAAQSGIPAGLVALAAVEAPAGALQSLSAAWSGVSGHN